MTSKDPFLQAVLNRLAARMEKKFSDLAGDFAVAAKEAPEKFQKEWGHL